MSDYYAQTCPGPLFAKPAPAQQHSITSMRAADSLDATTLNRLHRQVLAFLETRPDGATDEEMQAGLGMKHPTSARPEPVAGPCAAVGS